jgi:hypothetical protein
MAFIPNHEKKKTSDAGFRHEVNGRSEEPRHASETEVKSQMR